ncbi:MAG: hypothetical protein BWY09_01405 [Candidatus Hydrogenedentes bacterium ADurb.Bin179]|nr:MAG: hypothetical protein BWY09_01405 [Candidatus Hydrogenedentes bacterium ADurb.Bin179]
MKERPRVKARWSASPMSVAVGAGPSREGEIRFSSQRINLFVCRWRRFTPMENRKNLRNRCPLRIDFQTFDSDTHYRDGFYCGGLVWPNCFSHPPMMAADMVDSAASSSGVCPQ